MEFNEDNLFEDVYITEDPLPIIPRPNHTPEHYKLKKSLKPPYRTPEEWAKIFEPYPKMPDGYMEAYQHTEVAQFKAALEKYGFVVIKLLDNEQCDKTVPEFFWDINRRATNQKEPLHPDKPWTWETCNWPAERRTKFLVTAPALTQHAFENRTSPILYEIYTHLLGTTELWCNIDNWGCFRGTKNLKWITKDGQETVRDRDDWRYNLLLHWDYNPWVLQKWMDAGEAEPFQGLVALADCPEEVGGFMAVPGSHTFMSQWIKERPCPRMSRASMRPPPDDPMQSYMQKVPLRKGEMVIWYSRTAHCNFPNNSHKMRIHQYVRCLPATKKSQDKDRYAPRRIKHQYRNDPFTDWNLPYLTPLGRKMVGLDNWDGTLYVPKEIINPNPQERVIPGEDESDDPDETEQDNQEISQM